MGFAGLKRGLKSAATGCLFLVATTTVAPADEADARSLLAAMSDYLVSLDAFSFDFDESHDVVTGAGEKLTLVSSGSVAIERPGHVRLDKAAGFTNIEMAYDGQDLAVFDSASGLYAQVRLPGNLDTLIDALREDYGRPLPAADLLVGRPAAVLMDGVTEVKDLGTGVVAGTECDHLAFRAELVDWQIWIAHGDQPFPCMFQITTRDVAQAPEYRVEIRNWRADDAGAEYGFAAPVGATAVEIDAFVAGARAYPDNFTPEAQQ